MTRHTIDSAALLRTILRTIADNLLPVGLPVLFYGLHALRFRNWIMDDAGISFAYARNLAHGYGLVAQPGLAPVEGFSNPLWVFVLSPFLAIGAFDPNVTPKLVSLALVIASFVAVRSTLSLVSPHFRLGTFLVLSFLAFNPSFVIWTTSGLENALYVFLVSLLAYALVRESVSLERSARLTASVAVLVALCALTRPDGIVYLAAYPVVLAVDVVTRRRRLRESAGTLLLYGAVFAVVFGAYKLFTLSYFGDVVPNTYYAKGGELENLPYKWWDQTRTLLHSVGLNTYMIAGVLLALSIFWMPRAVIRPLFGLLVLLLISMAIYALLPRDWMGENRFATPFFLLFYLVVFLVVEAVFQNARSIRLARPIMAFLMLSAVGRSLAPFQSRSDEFAQSPTIPFSMIAHDYGFDFDRYASMLGIARASFLVPDMGGTLYYSQLKLYDLAGLTDKTIARTLWNDTPAFHDYVFGVLKPTFIHTHNPWDVAADFDGDPRFRRDYVPIQETLDAESMAGQGLTVLMGNYVRKDALTDADMLQRLRSMPWP